MTRIKPNSDKLDILINLKGQIIQLKVSLGTAISQKTSILRE